MASHPRRRFYIGFSTVPNKKSAQAIIAHLLDLRLIACANLWGPVESHYVWKGKRCKAPEYVIKMKFAKRNYLKIQKTLLDHHPYETPEFLALEISQGYQPYLDWVWEMSS